MESNPVVSIVVCHHTGTLLGGFLESVTYSSEVPYEIIVVTDKPKYTWCSNPTFYFEHVERNPMITWVDSNAMPARKRNRGAKVAKGKYLAFFDDDVTIEPDCLKVYVSFMEANPHVGMAYGKLYNMEHRTRLDEAGGYLTWNGFIWSRAEQNIVDDGRYDKAEPILAGKSASCIMRKDIFDKVGGFDEEFGILGEETDLSWRVWLQGHSVYFVPDAVGYHAFNTRFKPVTEFYTSERVHRNGPRNYIALLVKNLGREHLWIIPIHVAIWTFVGLAMIGTGKWRAGKLIMFGVWDAILLLPKTLRKRLTVQSTRCLGEKELFKLVFRKRGLDYYWVRFCRYLEIGLHG